MLDRAAAGAIPRKHHIAFHDEHGALRWEECLTRQGFDGTYTIAYHTHRPHEGRVGSAEHGFVLPVAADASRALARRHYLTQRLEHSGGPAIDARVPLLFNQDLVCSVVRPNVPDPVYFVNADADELFYVFRGAGLLRSELGDLRFEAKDYVVVPKGITYRFLPDEGVDQSWLAVEAQDLHLPQKWRNEVGQLRMDAPYCHRDFRRPAFVGPIDEGIRDVVMKRDGRFHGFLVERSPLDVVGWDGAVYPFVFPILNFQPRVGLVHLPPDVHGTFATRGALICSFVPRAVDFHPEAIPCPYPHRSVDCDEVIFYCSRDFTSRRGLCAGSISHHPAGVPHGPHPGAYESSLGVHETKELAVMMDTLRPLHATPATLEIEDPSYHDSFIG